MSIPYVLIGFLVVFLVGSMLLVYVIVNTNKGHNPVARSYQPGDLTREGLIVSAPLPPVMTMIYLHGEILIHDWYLEGKINIHSWTYMQGLFKSGTYRDGVGAKIARNELQVEWLKDYSNLTELVIRLAKVGCNCDLYYIHNPNYPNRCLNTILIPLRNKACEYVTNKILSGGVSDEILNNYLIYITLLRQYPVTEGLTDQKVRSTLSLILTKLNKMEIVNGVYADKWKEVD